MTLDQQHCLPEVQVPFDAQTLPQERESLLAGNHTSSSSGTLIEPHQQPTFIHVGDLAWWRRPLVITFAKNSGLVLLWYFLGTFLSLWNKLLLGKDRGIFGQGPFPAPFLMSSTQFFFQHMIARLFFAAGFSKRRGEPMTWKEYGRTVVPNGVATGLDIGFSNYSLVFITLSFYVMCKSTTPLFLLTFAIIWGIEKPSWGLAGVVAVITFGLLLLVAGETRFDLVGFILVMSAAALSGLRWTITQVLLQGSKHHGSTSPIEVIFHLTPIMGLTLALISLFFEKLWVIIPGSPYFASIGHTLATIAIIATGGVIAFSMVWAEFMLIANTSALTFMVVGTFKEIVTVGAAVLFLHEKFTVVNAMGLLVLILGVMLFNYLKYMKMRQGTEITVVPLDDEEAGCDSCFGAVSGGNVTPVGKDKRPEEMENGFGGGGGGGAYFSGGGGGMEHAMNSGGGGGGGSGIGVGAESSIESSIEMAISTSRPPSPHLAGGGNGMLRRVMVVHEEDDPSVALASPGGSGKKEGGGGAFGRGLRRQQSI